MSTVGSVQELELTLPTADKEKQSHPIHDNRKGGAWWCSLVFAEDMKV